MTHTCIVAAKRTPQGRFMGALAKHSAPQLAVAAGRACLERISPDAVDLVIIGNVLAAGQGMNIARQIGLKLGVPIEATAFTVNMMCASGMHAVVLAAQAIQSGQASVVLCGGAESMSNAPYLLDRARYGYKLGDGVLADCLLRDGLVDSIINEHMGLTVERIAEQYHITRAQQDEWALMSHRRYAAAQSQGKFNDERVAIDELEQDEHPRCDTTMEKLSALKPAFSSKGTVTPGNASGINDGAALLIVCDTATAKTHGWKPLATIHSSASIGCDPGMMGLGPVHAAKKLCSLQQLRIDDFDTIEINEAFAPIPLAWLKELQADPQKLNVNGGAIALGHPVGNSGCRLSVSAIHELQRRKAKYALVSLCTGGGMAPATIFERV